MKKLIYTTIAFICLLTIVGHAQVKSKVILQNKSMPMSRSLLINQKMKINGTLRPASSVKLFKLAPRIIPAFQVGYSKSIDSKLLESITAKNKTYPDGSTAHYAIVRKTDGDANDGGNLQPKLLAKDNTATGGTPDTNPNDTKGGTQLCTFVTKNYSVTSMDQGMLTPGALGNITVGGVYNLSDMQKGNYKPIIDNRSPVMLQMSDKATDPIVVKNPTLTDLNQSVAILRNQPFPYQPQGFGQYLDASLVTSASDLDLAIGASYSGWGISLNDQFKYNKSSNKTTFLLDYCNPVYSIAATPGDPTNSLFFNKGDVRNDDPSLIYIDKITYGVHLMVYFESDQSASTISNAFSGNALGGTLTVDAKYKDNFSNTTFKIYLYGNRSPVSIPVQGADALVSTYNDLITKIVSQTPYVPMVLGQPISYSMRFVNDNSIAATTCSVLNSPVTYCNVNPDGPQSLQVWISDAHRWSTLNPTGFTDIEVLDKNGITISNQNLYDGDFTDNEANRVNHNLDNVQGVDYGTSPYRLHFDNISKEDREGGTLRIWNSWYVKGHWPRCFCANENMPGAPDNASSNGYHHDNNHQKVSYIDIPLKEIEIPNIGPNNTQIPYKKSFSFNGDWTSDHGHLNLGIASRFITP